MNVADFLSTPARQHATVEETAHRPWPLPGGSWVMAQTWDDLLFAHWPVPVAAVAEHVPPRLPVDTFDGSAWVGITPFRLTGLRLRAAPPAPFLSSFLELNARTYVTLGGKPGIWFFSLDAASRLAVAAARRAYRLPYFHARMTAEPEGGALRYTSTRLSERERPAEFAARYAATGDVFQAPSGSLEYFVTERYCLYTVDDGHVFRAEIHHPPWPLQPGAAELERNTMAPPGVRTEGEPLFHYAARQDVLIWPLAGIDGEGGTG
jgi:uncharacterized protein YqjF (DUF2071 family)